MTQISIKKSFKCAFKGILHPIKTERNLKIQIITAVIVIIISIFLKIQKLEFAIILLTCTIVLSLELINTALEKLIDKIHPKIDFEIGKIKDILASSVLIAAAVSIIIGLLILLQPLIMFIKTFL